jgi:hypothetical protein
MLNVDDAELVESTSSLVNVGVRNNFSNVSERENVKDDDDDDDDDECELSRLSSEISLFDNEIVGDARGRDEIFEQRFRTNGQKNDEGSDNSISTKN